MRTKISTDASLSSIAETIANQIKVVKGSHDAIGLSVRMLDVEEDEEGEIED